MCLIGKGICVCMFVCVLVYVYIPQYIFVNICGKLKRCAWLCHGKGEEIVTVRDMVALAYRKTMDRLGHLHELSRWRDVLYSVVGKLHRYESCDSKAHSFSFTAKSITVRQLVDEDTAQSIEVKRCAVLCHGTVETQKNKYVLWSRWHIGRRLIYCRVA